MLLPIRLPPGIVIAGTQYQSKGYWFDGNLIRFFERSSRPVGGWELLTDVSAPARGIHAWRSNDSVGRLILGTSDSVFAYANGNLVDISPTGDFGTPPDPPAPPTYVPKLFGAGLFGAGPFGVGVGAEETPPSNPTPGGSIPLVADDNATWVFDNFGELPIGVMSSDGKIRSWSLDDTENFEILSDTAPDCRAVVVTPERFLMALGAAARSLGYLVFSIQPTDADTVTIGTQVYTFKNTIATTAGHVKIGATVDITITNLAAAINQSAGAGTLYGNLTEYNPDVSATTDLPGLTLVVAARLTGIRGDGVALASSNTANVWATTVTEGGEGSPAAVSWASRETTDEWIPTESNTAGDDILTSVGRVMNGKRMPRETLIWTDTDLHSAIYIGGTLLYTFEWRGDKCGAIAPNAMVVIGDTAYWMSDNGFFRYDGAVRDIPCAVHDFIFTGLNKTKAQRVYAVSVSQYGEIWWFYPSGTSTEVDKYVVYNYKENHWNIGTLARVAGVDRGVFLVPIMVGTDGKVWLHETGTERPGADPLFLESGPVEIEEGNNVWMVRRLVPDEANIGECHAFVAPSFYPTDPVPYYGPYTPLSPTSVRLTGRQMRFKIQETVEDTDFRIGLWRIDAVGGGER